MSLPKTLVIGCGSIGRRHALNAKALGAEIVLCDLNPQLLKDFGDQHGFIERFTDYREALRVAKPAAVVIASPSSLHLEHALQVAEAGAHILMEKPLSHTAEGLASLLDTVDQRRIIFMMAQSYRFHEGMQQVKNLVDEGAIGIPLHAEFSGGWYLPDWHWQQDYRKEYAAQKRLGGGVLLTDLSHVFDTIHWLFGSITDIQGWKSSLADLDVDVEDYVSCVVRTRTGVMVSVVDDFISRFPRNEIRIYGTEGNLRSLLQQHIIQVWNIHTHRFQPGDPRGQKPAGPVQQVLEGGIQYDTQPRQVTYAFETNARYRREMAYFFERIEQGITRFDLDIHAGLRVIPFLLSPKIRPQMARNSNPAVIPARDKAAMRPRVAAIVACRTQSSRLPQKALLPLQGASVIERCLQNCLLMEEVDDVILATTTEPADEVLEQHTLGKRVRFWRGDREDVIARYLGACEAYGVDIVVRVTGDCPIVSPAIARQLLAAHLESGADFTTARQYAVGSNSEIINVSALQRVAQLCGHAPYSEYMSWYLKNNPHLFKINFVDLPSRLVRDYRLTLDYPEDLQMFEQLFAELAKLRADPYLENIYRVLDQHPEIVALNKDLPLKYRDDPEFIELLTRVTRIAVPAVDRGDVTYP
jgi:spore coat polysaccharide biosynthesis protein SpsF (cytidylyltransferase family)/predicted dehydrogenase